MHDVEQIRPPTLVDRAWQMVYRLGFPIARAWWTLRQGRHEGALVAVYVGADLLLLRSSYRAEWNFPGGGVRTGEAPAATARRELWEEIGLAASALVPAGVVSGVWDGRPDRVHLFELRLERLPPLQFDNREIVGARLVESTELDDVAVTGPVARYVRDGAPPAGNSR